MQTNNMLVNDGEKVIVHRGLNSPICVFAEQNKRETTAIRDGYRKSIAGILYGVQDSKGDINLRLHDVGGLAVKTVGESNALIHNIDSPFFNWWCHVMNINGLDFGLIGRPNRHKLGGQYEIGFPHHISTRTWRTAMDLVPLRAPEFAPDVYTAKYPNLTAALDPGRTKIDYTGWRMA